MDPTRRQTLQEEAFLRPPTKLGGYTLRPLSAASLIVLRRTGNLFATQGEVNMESAEGMQAALAFVYIHAEPLDEVLEAHLNPAAFDLAVLRFAAQFPVTILQRAIRTITGQLEQVAASAAEPETSDTEDEEGDDPNGRGRRGSATASQRSRVKRAGRNAS
jgi:hypothetical protein